MNHREVLLEYPDLEDGGGVVSPADLPITVLSGGLINETWALGRGYVLQRLHRIFSPDVNRDIAALVPHLLAGGVPVPSLVRTRNGEACVAVEHGDAAGTWRLLTRVPGVSRPRLNTAAEAETAGRMVGRFHTALLEVRHVFAFTRPGVHDTSGHIARAVDASDDPALSSHPLRDDVRRVVSELADRVERWGPVPSLPRRLIHGDLKVSNLLWSSAEPAAVTGVVDLDTMASDGLDVELGDGLRSWCNVAAEDEPVPRFSLEVHALAMTGYLGVVAPWVTSAEVEALPAATERIALELAARFAADALRESYFGWDSARYATRGAHNLARAQGQLFLARVLSGARPLLERNVERALRAAKRL